LKLSYYQDDRAIDFYLALDDDDIAELEAVLQRAKAKTQSLSTLLQSANMKIVKG
jgi:hypothetical protein